jgi:hypothetical protein
MEANMRTFLQVLAARKAHLYAKGNEEEKFEWLNAKSKAMLELIKSYAAGVGFFAASLALPHTKPHNIPAAIAGFLLLLVGVATAGFGTIAWATSWKWHPLREAALYGGFVIWALCVALSVALYA